MNCRRILALLLCLVIAFSMTAFSVFSIHEAGHCCAGEGCAVCARIRENACILRTFSLIGLTVLVLAVFMPSIYEYRFDFRRFAACPSPTLTGLKIRLND